MICNRPDGEGADQPGFSEIQEVAAREGLVMRYLPAESGKVTDEQGADAQALVDAALGGYYTGGETNSLLAGKEPSIAEGGLAQSKI